MGKLIKHLVILFLSILLTVNLYAGSLALPRFVSIKSSKMNSRVGPGFDYPVIWHYWRKNMPVEIIEEYDQWRKIRDFDGDISWVYQSLLSGTRNAIVREGADDDKNFLPILSTPKADSRKISKAEVGAIAKIYKCDGTWCSVGFGKTFGYVLERKLWGVYPNEVIK